MADAVTRSLAVLERAKLALVAVAGALVLLYVGAKVERHLMKRQLAVLDGATEGGDVDLTEGAAGGRRS